MLSVFIIGIVLMDCLLIFPTLWSSIDGYIFVNPRVMIIGEYKTLSLLILSSFNWDRISYFFYVATLYFLLLRFRKAK